MSDIKKKVDELVAKVDSGELTAEQFVTEIQKEQLPEVMVNTINDRKDNPNQVMEYFKKWDGNADNWQSILESKKIRRIPRIDEVLISVKKINEAVEKDFWLIIKVQKFADGQKLIKRLQDFNDFFFDFYDLKGSGNTFYAGTVIHSLKQEMNISKEDYLNKVEEVSQKLSLKGVEVLFYNVNEFKSNKDLKELAAEMYESSSTTYKKRKINETAGDKEFISKDKDRKIIFTTTKGGKTEYAVCDYDDVARTFDKPRFEPFNGEWLEEEKDAFSKEFADYVDKLKKLNESATDSFDAVKNMPVTYVVSDESGKQILKTQSMNKASDTATSNGSDKKISIIATDSKGNTRTIRSLRKNSEKNESLKGGDVDKLRKVNESKATQEDTMSWLTHFLGSVDNDSISIKDIKDNAGDEYNSAMIDKAIKDYAEKGKIKIVGQDIEFI